MYAFLHELVSFARTVGAGGGVGGEDGRERKRGRGGWFSVRVAVVPFSPAPKHEEHGLHEICTPQREDPELYA